MRHDLTTGQVARLLGLSQSKVRDLCIKGLLPSYRLPPCQHRLGDRRIRRKDLEAFAREWGVPVEEKEE